MFDPIGIETAENQVFRTYCRSSARAWISQEGVRQGCPSISVTSYGLNPCKINRESALRSLITHAIDASAVHCLAYSTVSPECPCVG